MRIPIPKYTPLIVQRKLLWPLTSLVPHLPRRPTGRGRRRREARIIFLVVPSSSSGFGPHWTPRRIFRSGWLIVGSHLVAWRERTRPRVHRFVASCRVSLWLAASGPIAFVDVASLRPRFPANRLLVLVDVARFGILPDRSPDVVLTLRVNDSD